MMDGREDEEHIEDTVRKEMENENNPSKGKGNLRKRTYTLIDFRKIEIVRLIETIGEMEEKKRKGEIELVEFQKNGNQGGDVMGVLARQRFNNIIDIQLMVKRSRTEVNGMNKSQQLEIITQKKIRSYRSRVRKYLDYLLGRKKELKEELRILRMTGDKGQKGSLAYGESFRVFFYYLILLYFMLFSIIFFHFMLLYFNSF